MKVISIDGGRTAQAYVADEITPPGGLYIPEFIRLVTDRYGFVTSPTAESTAEEGAKFRGGRLISGTKKINITELNVFNDGVTVDAKNTSESDFVLDDFVTWAREIFSFRDPLTLITRKYDSVVVVEFDAQVTTSIRVFEAMSQRFSATLKNSYGVEPNIDLTRIVFGSDLKPSHDLHKSEFVIERRAGQPFIENRFFSMAPVRTETHLELLEAFEREMTRPSK